jgi:hypothetical protein
MAAFLGNNAALALQVQSAENVPAAISTSLDMMSCYDLRPGSESYTIANPEYTGAIEARGDAVLGRSRSVSFNMIIRGPGGTTPPAAGTWVPGRLLRAKRMTETVQTTPLLASSAMIGIVGQEIQVVGTASAVNGAYKGLPLQIDNQGTGAKRFSYIREYDGGTKKATMAETFTVAPTGNVSIPAFLAYRYDQAAPQLFLTVAWWLDKKRYQLMNGVISSWQENFNVSNNDQTAFTFISVTITGDVHTTPEIDETAPVPQVTSSAMPVFRDADFWIANRSICGSGLTVDHQIQTARAPCPSTVSGGEAPQMTRITRTVNTELNEVLLSVADYNALAEAQLPHCAWLMYGNTTGRTVLYGIPNARMNFSEAQISGEFVTRPLPMMIDEIHNSMSYVFPYWT